MNLYIRKSTRKNKIKKRYDLLDVDKSIYYHLDILNILTTLYIKTSIGNNDI